jgi:signal transduction histidine kinase
MMALVADSTETALPQLAQDRPGVQQRLQTMHTLGRDTERYLRGFLGGMAESATTWQEFGNYLRYCGYTLVDPLELALDIALAVVLLPPPTLPLKICLFRCYTEALSNIMKHA